MASTTDEWMINKINNKNTSNVAGALVAVKRLCSMQNAGARPYSLPVPLGACASPLGQS